ncbi:hypothetical protein MKX01_011296 [Papaver californicum]|nr:hypothetical protein MKX01_011296 [Papaver californicum]
MYNNGYFLALKFRSPLDKFWKSLKTWYSILPVVLPDNYKSIKVIEDVNREKNGSVTLRKMNPSILIEKALVMMEEKKKLGSVDEVTKTLTYNVISGDVLKLYKVIDDNVKESDETMGGGIVKWSMKYEKVNEIVPLPNMVKALIYKTILILDEHILSRQKEVVEQKKIKKVITN